MPPHAAVDWNAARGALAMTGLPEIPSEVRTRQLFTVISTTIFLAFATPSYFIRLWARKRSFQKLRLQADDWPAGSKTAGDLRRNYSVRKYAT